MWDEVGDEDRPSHVLLVWTTCCCGATRTLNYKFGIKSMRKWGITEKRTLTYGWLEVVVCFGKTTTVRTCGAMVGRILANGVSLQGVTVAAWWVCQNCNYYVSVSS